MNETYFYCVQCTDKTTGKVGDFVYSDKNPFCSISPVFNSLCELFSWMLVNNFKPKEYDDRGYNYTPFRLVKNNISLSTV